MLTHWLWTDTVVTGPKTIHFLQSASASLGDLLSGFSLLFCLFACYSFCTHVCICNNKQKISFSWSNCRGRPFPNLQHSSLTHIRVAAFRASASKLRRVQHVQNQTGKTRFKCACWNNSIVCPSSFRKSVAQLSWLLMCLRHFSSKSPKVYHYN